MALGVGRGELAAGVAGAGDEAAADARGCQCRPECLDRALHCRRSCSSGMSEISRFCQTVRRIVPLPNRSAMSARPRICAHGHPPDRQHDADVEQARLLLRVEADVAVLVDGAARLARVERHARRSVERQLLLGLGDELLEAPAVEHVLEPGLLAVGAVAVLDEHADDRGGDGDALVGRQQHAGVAGEVLVAGDAAELHAEVDAGAAPLCPSATRTAVKPMSFVSSSALTRPPPSKAMLNLRGRPYSSRWLRM